MFMPKPSPPTPIPWSISPFPAHASLAGPEPTWHENIAALLDRRRTRFQFMIWPDELVVMKKSGPSRNGESALVIVLTPSENVNDSGLTNCSKLPGSGDASVKLPLIKSLVVKGGNALAKSSPT